jgi:hypothetical protein
LLLLRLCIVAALMTSPAIAGTDDDAAGHYCSKSWEALSAQDKNALSYENYIATCMKDAVGTPGADLATVTGLCKDSTYTMSRDKKTACSDNGGLAMWFLGS